MHYNLRKRFHMIRYNKIMLIYTGGTIGMGRSHKTGALRPLDFNHLESELPELQYVEAKIDVYPFEKPIDSSDMSPAIWAKLVDMINSHYDAYDGFVILHGTDTMAYTASALSFMLENLTKPVILTGSQLPIGQMRTDGKENVISSIELASAHYPDGTPKVPEVCIYFNGHLLRGNRSIKVNAEGFNAFETPNYPHLCEVGVNFSFNDHYVLLPNYRQPMVPHLEMNPNVIVFSLFPGVQESIIHHVTDAPELRGIVMRSYGSGNAPQKEWVKRLLDKATRRGIVIVNISQCLSGSVEMERYATGYQLQDIGVISGHDSTVEAAVTKLMLLLAEYNDTDEVRKMMDKPIAGEITL